MNSFKRPDASIKFGNTGKPGSQQKRVKRDEVGELELNVIIADSGRTRINFNKPLTYLELQPDKAYDLAHLILEHVKDKQGGEPVNITEEKIVDALEFALETNGILSDHQGGYRQHAVIMAVSFMQHMASAPEARKAADAALADSPAVIEGPKP